MSRLTIQRVLGAIWLLDGLLQFRPKMFTEGFIHVNVATLLPGQPRWLDNLLRWEMFMAHPEWSFNLMIAIIQTAIGISLVTNRLPKPGLAISIIWGSGVWIFGEGLGNIARGQWSITQGAPGAAILYVLLAIMIWPVSVDARTWRPWALPMAVGTLAVGAIVTVIGLGSAPMATAAVSGSYSAIVAALLLFAVIMLFTRARILGAVILLGAAIAGWIFLQHGEAIWLSYTTDINSGGIWALVALSLGTSMQIQCRQAVGAILPRKAYQPLHHRAG